MKRRVGRPKGSVNKKSTVAATTTSVTDLTRIVLEQLEQLKAIKNLEIVTNILTANVRDMAVRIAKLEAEASPANEEAATPPQNGLTDAALELE